MICFLAMAVLFAVGFFILKKYSLNDFKGFWGAWIMIMSVALGFIGGAYLGIERMTFHAEHAQLESFRQTLSNMRETESVENAAIQIKIAEWNQWIEKKKYWNNTVVDLWIPDTVESIDPLR